MYYVLTRREELLQYFPKGSTGVEIGVAQGDFSAEILQSADPRELHLIDPWSHLEPGSDPLRASELLSEVGSARERCDQFSAPPENREGDEQFASISARFAADQRVRLHRQYSYKAVAEFAQGALDFAYSTAITNMSSWFGTSRTSPRSSSRAACCLATTSSRIRLPGLSTTASSKR